MTGDYPGGSFFWELVELDLASLASVRVCVDALTSNGELFDLVIANAGVMACPKGQTSEINYFSDLSIWTAAVCSFVTLHSTARASKASITRHQTRICGTRT